MTARRVAGDYTITPTPKVKGDVFPPRSLNLSWLDAKGAFTTGQFVREGRDTAETDEGNETIDFDEVTTAEAATRGTPERCREVACSCALLL